MIDALGPYAGYILACYAIATVTILGLIAWVTMDHAGLTRKLREMEERGVRRRSARLAAGGSDRAESKP